MTIINPYMAAARRGPDLFKSRAMAARKKRHDDAWSNYLSGTHTFELFLNRDSTGEFKEMTGREANAHNANFKQDYTDEVGRAYPEKTTAKMGRWVLVEGGVKQ